MIFTCPRCGQDFELDDTTQDVSDLAEGCRDPDCPVQAYQSNPWGDLRKHWEESYAREQSNPPPDKPTYSAIAGGGRFCDSAPVDAWVWTIEPPSLGVFLSRKDNKGRWWHAEAGDLWPGKPTLWLPRKL